MLLLLVLYAVVVIFWRAKEGGGSFKSDAKFRYLAINWKMAALLNDYMTAWVQDPANAEKDPLRHYLDMQESQQREAERNRPAVKPGERPPGTILFQGEYVDLTLVMDYHAGQRDNQGKRQESNPTYAEAFGKLSKPEQLDILQGRSKLNVTPDPGLPEGCTNRNWIGTGGIEECDGCCTTLKQSAILDGCEIDQLDWKICPRCQYAACENCTVHHSRGTCHCKDSNFGYAYPELSERQWYQHGKW